MRRAVPEKPLFVRPGTQTPGAKGQRKSNEGIINVQTLNINKLSKITLSDTNQKTDSLPDGVSYSSSCQPTLTWTVLLQEVLSWMELRTIFS